jgi:hypothetical protein
MGNIHTPKTIYFEGGAIEFFVKKKQIYFKTVIWTKDGSKQFTFETGKFDYCLNQDEKGRTVSDIIKSTLQSFGDVIRQ